MSDLSHYDDDNPNRTPGTPPSQMSGIPSAAPSMPPPAIQPGYTPADSPLGGASYDPLYGLQYGQPQRPVVVRRRVNIACLGCALALVSTAGVLICGLCMIITMGWSAFSREATLRWERAEKSLDPQAVTPQGTPGTPSTSTPGGQKAFQTTYIYDRQGNELYQLFGEGRRTRVKLADVSKNLIDATVAVEDASFFQNPGVDLGAIFRAGLKYFQGEESGGASTITQQLVRNLAFDYEYRTERSARRKLEEILMALVVTQQRSKDEILEMYLNLVYYGNLAYGIEAASRTYFNKSAKDLSLAEASLLAGLPQAPVTFDPFNPKAQDVVLARRRVVLDLMVDKGKITRQQATEAEAQALVYANPNVALRAPHFTVYAEQQLKDLLPAINLSPNYLNTGGLSVYTTLDTRYQSLAERVAQAQIASIKAKNNANNAAVIVLKPATGEILAMVGSVNYRDDSIDGRVNVTTAPRQPGSAMKPLTYAAAMEKGFSAASVLWDVETNIGLTGRDVYSPVDYDRRFHGPVRLRDALANSYNIPAVLTLRQIGVETLLSYAQRVGVRSLGQDASKYGLSLTLGGGELTPLELTQAYSVFANEGNFVPATSILCIVNYEGNIVYQYENGCEGRNGKVTESTINAAATPKAVLDPRIAFVIRDILADNAARTPAMGSNSPLRTDGITTSVKTGTTNSYRDNWTVGFTRNVAVGVWVGNADNTEMKNTTGLTGAAPIWNEVITTLYRDPALLEPLKRGGNLLPDGLTPPPGVSRRKICNISSLKDPAVDCAATRNEWFLDTPALIPDSNGDLKASAPGPVSPTRAPQNGPLIVDMEPGLVKTLVFPLDSNFAASLIMQPVGPKHATPPPPMYCLVPNEVKDQVPQANAQIFLKPPVFGDEDVYARIYAQANQIPILPQFPCTPEMLALGPGVTSAIARITSPQPGDTVTGLARIMGTASWAPGQATYYVMTIQGPQFPNPTPFIDVNPNPVVNGFLGSFGAAGLQPGTYKIKIIIVGIDGNYLLVSPEVPITITGQ